MRPPGPARWRQQPVPPSASTFRPGGGRGASGLRAAALCATLAAAAHADETPPPQPQLIVPTTAGLLQGTVAPDAAVRSFRGVPYAEPPTGPRRWRPPVRKGPWEGVRSAAAYGADCAQLGPAWPSLGALNDTGQLGATSEDCLFLNVYTPSWATPASRLPVVVFLPAGAFSWGAAADRENDGGQVGSSAAPGWGRALLLTVNYRLGALGFLTSKGLRARGPGAGVYGLLDQQVRKTPSWPRSWANYSLLQLYSHRNAWANLHLMGQPNTFLATGP